MMRNQFAQLCYIYQLKDQLQLIEYYDQQGLVISLDLHMCDVEPMGVALVTKRVVSYCRRRAS